MGFLDTLSNFFSRTPGVPGPSGVMPKNQYGSNTNYGGLSQNQVVQPGAISNPKSAVLTSQGVVNPANNKPISPQTLPAPQSQVMGSQTSAAPAYTLGDGSQYDTGGNRVGQSSPQYNSGTQDLGFPNFNPEVPGNTTSTSSLGDTTGSGDITSLLGKNLDNMDQLFSNLSNYATVGGAEQDQQKKVASDQAAMTSLGYQSQGLYNPGNQTIAMPFLTGQAKNQMVGAGIQSTLDQSVLNYMQGNRQFAFNSASTIFDKAKDNVSTLLDTFTKLAPQNLGTNYNPTTGAVNFFTRNPLTGQTSVTPGVNIGPQKSLTPSGSPFIDPATGDYVQQFIQNGSTPITMAITGPNAGQTLQGSSPTLQGGGTSTGSLVSKNPNPQAVITTANGTSYDLTSYASGNAVGGPASQAANVNATLAKLPPITDAATATSAIQSIKSNSPITGDMVISAAQHYGVDPGVLIATMQAETQLGTDGSKGSRQNNFGNVGNTDSLMASGGSKGFGTAQDGVNAVAQNLANRQIKSTQQQAPKIPQYQDVYNAVSPTVRPALKPAPDGSAYIDQGELKTDAQQTQAQALSGRYGIPIKSSAEVSDIQGLQTAISNLSTVATKFSEIASPSAAGAITHNISDPLSKLFGTAYGNNVSAYQDNQESLYQQVKTLATGSPRLSEQGLNLAQGALPSWNEGSHDTLAGGQLKIAATQRLLDNAVRTYLPNYKGSIISMNGQYLINDPQTNTPHVFNSYSAAQQAQQLLSLTPNG